ncbi:MAG: Aldehyde ferredoxin oxidoreductase, domains 2 & 3 [Pelotomaculum sp. PtaB.Bin104]|nr:MAG: Aldehyde ferredoxin oxidoreductase, domains 2 & 3 [Pelotomaculum sp. PtaB.Bin104]
MAAFKELDYTYSMLGKAMNYGLDNYSTPQLLAFAIELYNDGILTDEDLPNFPEDPGDRILYLLEMVVHREGIGDTLALGITHAAKKIGKGAEKYDHNTVKGFEQLPIKLGKLNPAYFLMIATAEKMAITQIEGSFPQDPLPTVEERQKFCDEWEATPDPKFKKYFMEWEKRSDFADDRTCEVVDWNETMHYVDDATGLCGFVSSFRGQFGGKVAYHLNNVPKFITLATGIELDTDGLWEIARRNRTLIRAINNRLGMRRIHDRPPEDHWAVRDEEYEQQLPLPGNNLLLIHRS